MTQSRPIRVQPVEAMPGQLTPGTPRMLYDRDGRWLGWAGWVTNDAGDVSGWHHHGENDTYVYVSRGSVTIEFGGDGNERVVAKAGDFFVVPSGTVHRELTGSDGDLEAFIFRIGGQPEHVNVEGPAPVKAPVAR